MTLCKHCGKGIDRGKWCSDRCRMSYKRSTEPEHKPEQVKVEHISRCSGYEFPELPDDLILKCNSNVGWSDILTLSREVINDVYRTSEIMGIPLLLRLRRAAGSFKRVA